MIKKKKKNSQNKKNTRSKTLHFLTYVDIILRTGERNGIPIGPQVNVILHSCFNKLVIDM